MQIILAAAGLLSVLATVGIVFCKYCSHRIKSPYYEIISGHRRKYAAEKLGYKKIPVIIRMLQDDEAVVIMVDSNLQREQITPSEKAYAYKMKYDAIKKKAGRKNCSQVDHNTGKNIKSGKKNLQEKKLRKYENIG